MADPLNPDEAEDVSGSKENFVGRVVGSSFDGHPQAYLDDGNKASEQQFDSDVKRFDHFAYIEPLDGTYEKNQNVFGLSVRSGRQTKWMVMMAHLTDIFGPLEDHGFESAEDIVDLLEGRIFEWRDISWMEDEEVPGLDITYREVGRSNSQINEMLVPVREVTDENELADLGVTEAVEADEAVEL